MKKIKFKIYMTSFALVLFCIFEPLILFVSGYFAGWIFYYRYRLFNHLMNCCHHLFLLYHPIFLLTHHTWKESLPPPVGTILPPASAAAPLESA